MKVKLLDADLHLIDLKTRLPFQYGIATMTRAPHALVRVRLEIGGRRFQGIAADHLPPKWFTKHADKSIETEIDEMLRVIERALAAAPGLQGESVFDVWIQLYRDQERWARKEHLPPLLSQFGTSLIERAAIEAACRGCGRPFATAVRSAALGFRLEEFDRRLAGCRPVDLLPATPRRRVIARHTVGMADPLEDAEISPGERLHDGLPQSLAESIRHYGLRHFKIKIRGDATVDGDRLTRIAEVIRTHGPADFAFTLDGNEQFRTLDEFRQFWDVLTRGRALQPFFERLLFVEQPFHRDVALHGGVLSELRRWTERPLLIIDESDAELDSLRQALELGYHGTSHKNCKGVFKGLANACLLEFLRRAAPRAYVMSGEDLANIGPVALLQDLAVSATLGVESIERNGHHYFAGLSAFPAPVQEQVLASHPDLYHAAPAGWPTLAISQGGLELDTVLAAPFGVGFELDVDQFSTVEAWKRERGSS